MIDEDLTIFFEDGETCSHGGHNFKGHLNQPSRMESFDQADVMTRSRSFTAPAADVQTAGIQQFSDVSIESVTYPVIYPVSFSGCGRIATLQLGTPQ